MDFGLRPRPFEPQPPSPGISIFEAGLLLFGFVFLGFLLYEAQFSGSMRWFLGIVFLAAVATVAAWHVSRRSAEPVPLSRGPEPGEYREGELASLIAAVRRANRGLMYSQMSVSSRARDAFEEHLRLFLGLSLEEMRSLQRDPAAVRALVKDGILADFLVLRTASSEERYRWVRDARARGGFEAEFRRVQDCMEAWR